MENNRNNCFDYPFREELKNIACSICARHPNDLGFQVIAKELVISSHYERACGFLSHKDISFNDYAAMWLSANGDGIESKEVRDELISKYGLKPRLKHGTTYIFI